MRTMEAGAMKRTIGFLGCVAAITLLAAGNALAEQSGSAQRLDRLFEQIDLDASGTLTVQEMRAAAAARFNALDLNGDGKVTTGERHKSRGNRLKIRFDRADTDRSGTLDINEMQEVAKQRARRRLARLDMNGDGMLSLDELQIGRLGQGPGTGFGPETLTLPQLDARMMAMFRDADADGDGVVTLQEATNGAGG